MNLLTDDNKVTPQETNPVAVTSTTPEATSLPTSTATPPPPPHPSQSTMLQPAAPLQEVLTPVESTQQPVQNREIARSTSSPCEEHYQILKTNFKDLSTVSSSVLSNNQLRALLSRAVGIVNQLNNTKHDSSNRGKLQQLINLLSGRACTMGTTSVTTKDNPAALAFVKEQLSSKLISLSHDIQVTTMAIYVSLIVRLWQIFPDLGQHILFKLYETCPFLVPMEVKGEPNQSEEEFNRALGFKHRDGGTRESIDSYLTRMKAAASLYGRMISLNIDSHPHGLDNGWKWIARTLSSEPFPSVTAALLSGFLETAGNALLKRYGNQFRKIVVTLVQLYLPKMEKESLDGGAAVLAELKSLLEIYIKTGSIPCPQEGYELLL